MEIKLSFTLKMAWSILYKWWKYRLNRVFVSLIVVSCCASPSAAQVSMGGIILHNAPVLTLNNASDYENGVAIIDNTLSLSITANMNWSLLVKTDQHFNHLGNEIQNNLIELNVENTAYTTRPIFLSFEDQEIARGSSLSTSETIPIDIKYSCLGGHPFLQPNGDYTSTLIFTLTMVNM